MNFQFVLSYDTGWRAHWPTFWPGWLGGNKDFVEQGQCFYSLKELREATMLEF